MLGASEILWHASVAVASAQSTEQLARSLLDLLLKATSFDCAYLTSIDFEAGKQTILFSRNDAALQVIEGQTFQWNDSLCKRALADVAEFEKNLASHCNDSPGARALGIKMYAGRPIYLANDQIYGTLCVANAEEKPIPTEGKNALWLFASLISQQVQRDRLADELENTKRSLVSAQRRATQTGPTLLA